MDIIANNSIDIDMCVDTNVSRESSYKGIKVVPFEKIADIKNNCKVVVASVNYRFQMLEQLLRNGLNMNQIWFPPFEILRGYVGTQYFDFFEPRSKEIFVDGGYDGATTVDFFKWIGENRGVSYLFEANPKNETLIRDCLYTNNIFSNYYVILKGLYDAEGTLKFSTNDGPGARIIDEGDEIKVTSIDSTLIDKTDKVTLIKMDIEGAESKAIEGARRLIKRDSPRLALSVYHKPNDFIEIPLQLMEIHNDYRFAYRHYCTMGEETVLYAWRE